MSIGSISPEERNALIQGLNQAIQQQQNDAQKANEELKKSEEGQS